MKPSQKHGVTLRERLLRPSVLPSRTGVLAARTVDGQSREESRVLVLKILRSAHTYLRIPTLPVGTGGAGRMTFSR